MVESANVSATVELELPDGSKMPVGAGTPLLEVAKRIGPRLAKAALAARVNGELKDLSTPVTSDARVEFVTWDDEDGREVFRHTSAHILAQAVKRVIPEAKLTIGPPLSDSFYYDFDLPEPLSQSQLDAIEAEMQKIIQSDYEIRRHELPRQEAIELFRKRGEDYKIEIINELPDEETISCYEQGEFIDLCRGPHVPRTSYIKAIKLLSVAGAYWRGDARNKMLQRVYGTSFPDKKSLEEHLRLLEEAKKRDHRRIGKELDLFSFQEEGPGFPFFHPNGVIIYNELITFLREELAKRQYVEIMTPLILNEELWHRSGHWDHYKENMYFTEIDERTYAVKPMNCPGCLLVYKSSLRSYRDLPLKIAEFGRVHRHELSGVLHGLFRVRCFTQDDAHIFTTPEQLQEAIEETIEFIRYVYGVFGFDYHIELSTRPEKSIGSDEMWENATNALQHSLEKLNIQYKLNPGDGAFYGPKIDFHVKDSLKRSWQCGTIQVDFSMPERFDISYIGADGQKHRPVMVHRAIFGSLERFIGVLIEHTAGNLPVWLSPVQVAILPISEKFRDYSRQVYEELKRHQVRVTLDEGEEKIGAKIRVAELRKIPYMLIIGQKEMDSQSVSVRRHAQGDLGTMAIGDFIAKVFEEIRKRKA
ncbi:MAG: threonine--tRNA ligase [Candidatus Hydrogenedentota bacterium]|uniref:Threonine--tRNA ligase n=1 Tax=Sumerlaea chitinivorans TaxID=2250252 RepID=A0A2Z4Y3D8_SUMC1|nr:Threonyl-tRNA synthetase [Candidatus Sumerlaea chitinivorans]RMH25412.1 MAG: threonine--tRNA ligase [Candidatus Hydrogenedentota bacterium]GIX44316.1 MAG: threonine--tRNA ligase [Candidatus Sumerlaea sp.]